ncbi:T9SS type A sorting domain-containing protein [uncultured Psychroserpens sp.]|uniref:T9SS type A sorting domain-containing protein n=1 Tax=uncultured Psychroserpens sp. TaxID=255436 RepID=UPI00262F10E1|nr:T9SS type A sorting domain-containing protein [uncultured Psychroserpens sp.]
MKTKLLFLSLLLTSSIALSQVMAGQVDDFEDGTVQNWVIGGAAGPDDMPMNVSDGGPNGAGDNFLTYSSNGMNGMVASKMVIFNAGGSSQWGSNYISEGIIAIKMDVNVTINDLNLRVAFQGSGTRICTTNAVAVAAGSGWTSITIPISPADFTVISGSSSVNDALSNVNAMRILSNDTPAWSTAVNAIEATIGIDNITASTTLSTQDVQVQNDFEISPNPASSKLNIKLSNALDNANVTVYNVLGKKVYSKSLSALESSIDVSNWNSGVYLVRVSNDKQTITKRFVKQ